MKYGDRFGGTDRIINLGHPVESGVEHEKGGGATKKGVLLDGYTYRLRIPNNTGESRSSTTISQGQSTVIYTPVLSVSLTKRTRSLPQNCVFTKQDN